MYRGGSRLVCENKSKGCCHSKEKKEKNILEVIDRKRIEAKSRKKDIKGRILREGHIKFSHHVLVAEDTVLHLCPT